MLLLLNFSSKTSGTYPQASPNNYFQGQMFTILAMLIPVYYTCDDLCRKLEAILHNLVEDVEQLEVPKFSRKLMKKAQLYHFYLALIGSVVRCCICHHPHTNY